MIARTLVFGSKGELFVKNCQLVWRGNDQEARTIPLEDLGFIIIDSALVTISSYALQQIAHQNIALVICDGSHTPSAQIIPYTANTTTEETVQAQFSASDAVNGRLWRQIIRAKLENQATLLKRLKKPEADKVKTLAQQVKNYDETNCEAQGARIYFQALAPTPDFKRDREGIWPNQALNYGYAIIRAAVARALVGSGLLCVKGIHHHNRYNAFCLADDVMEPYRPFIDQYIFGKVPPFNGDEEELTKAMKARLLESLTCDLKTGDLVRPLMVALTYTSASLAKCYLGKSTELTLPSFI